MAYKNEGSIQVTVSLEDILVIFIRFMLELLIELCVSVLACIEGLGSRRIISFLRLGGLTKQSIERRGGKREA